MASSNLARLSGVLRRERDVLGLLVTRLADDPAGCDPLLRTVRVLELHRAAAGRAAAVELGAGDGATLQDLSEAAPAEWEAVLSGHRRALRSLAGVVLSLSGPGRGRAVQRSLREFLE